MVRRYLDTGDAKSMSNLRKHAKLCWGDMVVASADLTRSVQGAREALGKMKSVDSSITEAFQRAGKKNITYSHHQHTTSEAR
jgi:DNA-binding winged helix-turn-helix (wHTH) protein